MPSLDIVGWINEVSLAEYEVRANKAVSCAHCEDTCAIQLIPTVYHPFIESQGSWDLPIIMNHPVR
jgi:hypothetical protein